MRPKPITHAREVYSPSQLEMARRCLRSWALRYIYGIKTQTPASRSKILGTLIHKCVEIYINGRSMLSLTLDDLDEYSRKEVDAYIAYRADVLVAKALKKNPYANHATEQVNAAKAARDELDAMLRDAPQRALAGLAYLPPLEQCAQRYAELGLLIDTAPFYDHAVAFSDMSKLDLVVQAATGDWYLYDHKSTKGGKRTWTEVDEQSGEEVERSAYDPWLYVPTPEALARSVQFLTYAISVMQRAGTDKLWCRWIYYYTGPGAPDAKAVDVLITYSEAIANIQPWLELSDKLGHIIRETKARNVLPPLEQFDFPAEVHGDDSPCEAYGGCGYRGAHCQPPVLSAEQILARTRAVKRESKGDESMGLDQRVAQQTANGAPVLPSTQPMVNPAGYPYVPNVHGQMVVAPPGHPGHAGVPAGYVYPPGAVPVAGGAVEVPQAPTPQVLTPSQPTYTSASGVVVPVPTLTEVKLAPIPDNPADMPELFSQTSHTPSPEEVDACLAANPLPEEYRNLPPMSQPEKPKRTRRTKAEIEAEKGYVAELSPKAKADLEAGLESARNEPLVEVGSFQPEGIDGAVTTLARRAKEIGCDITVNLSLKGGQS